MTSATRRKVEPETPGDRRYLLACELLRRWRTISKLTNDELAEAAGIDPSTLSTAAAGKRRVSEDTWVLIGDGLKWGGFLDYIMAGNIEAAERCDFVDARIRIYGVEALRGIAQSDQ